MVSIEIINCCNSVKELYDSKDGSVGGYGHIVFDDGNLEDTHIRHCLNVPHIYFSCGIIQNKASV